MRRRIGAAAALLALLMMCLCTPALADGPDVTITLPEGSTADAQFSAWKLLDLEVRANKENPSQDEDYDYYYTVNAAYRSILNTVSGTSTDEALLNYIAGMKEGSTALNTWAKAVYTAIRTANITADYTTTDSQIATAAQGYYLIAETSEIGDHDARSLVMLDTHGATALSVTAKKDAPTAQLMVWNGDSYEKAVCAMPGETVRFQMTGKLPAATQYAQYSSYRVSFADELPEGFTYTRLTVKYGEADLTSLFNSSYDSASRTLTVACDNLKTAVSALTDGTQLTVTFDVKVPNEPVYGTAGNVSRATLTYSSDPYNESATATTVGHAAAVYASKLHVDNKDKDNNPLTGATFALYRVADSTETLLGTVAADSSTSTFEFSIAPGTYKLEQTVPPGHYMPVNDITFTVEAELTQTEDEQDATRLTGLTGTDSAASDQLTFTANAGLDTLSVTVKNTVQALRLPGTGGAGAAVYIGGGAVLLLIGVGALILLRMGRKEDDP